MITLKNRTALTLTLAAILLAGRSADAGKTLKWKLQKGQTFDVVVQTDMEQKQNIGGQQVDTTNQMKMMMTWEVLDVDAEGVSTIQQEMGRITMEMKSQWGLSVLTVTIRKSLRAWRRCWRVRSGRWSV